MSMDGLFQKYYKQVIQLTSSNKSGGGSLKEFTRLDNNYSRIEWFLKDPHYSNLLELPPNRTNKDLAKAQSLKDQGNKQFQKKNHAAALSAYNNAILLSPLRDSDGFLSLCYANRSAVLFHMHLYKDCILNIALSINHGYPADMIYKLLIRKTKCHQHVEINQMEKSLRAAEDSVKQSSLDDSAKEVWLKELQKISIEGVTETSNNDNCLTPAFDEPNHEYPALNFSVKVSENNEFGRYIQAQTDLSAGDVVLIEKPYCSITLPDYYLTHCCHCQKRCDVVFIPCQQCADVVFCSSDCQNDSWTQYHQFECEQIVNIKKVNVNMGHLALRTALCAGIATLEALVSGLNSNDRYFGIFELESHQDERSPQTDLLWRTAAAVLLARMVDVKVWSKGKENALQLFAAFTLHHMQVFPCNAHEISEMAVDEKVPYQSELLEIGAGIYHTLSYFNHSCDPTAVRTFYDGNKCIVRTLSPVKQYEQVFDNYGCLYAVHSLPERQRKLQSQYYFGCCCEACLRDWPLYSDLSYDSEPIYKCHKCNGMLIDQHCECCDITFNKNLTDSALKQAKAEFDKELSKLFSDNLEADQLTDTIKKLSAYSNLVNSLVFRPYKSLNDCQEALKHVFNSCGNRSLKN